MSLLVGRRRTGSGAGGRDGRINFFCFLLFHITCFLAVQLACKGEVDERERIERGWLC